MPQYRRYAVFYAPPAGSDLARFGASWLGWDAEARAEVAHPNADEVDVSAITAAPRKYGFHGTLKPPFFLADGVQVDDLAAAVGTLAARIAPFQTPHLALKRLSGFIALVPVRASADLAALAASCVTDLDRFRAPPSDEELARRRKAGLSTAQEENLVCWGYPYVMGEFRFHLTLTGSVGDEEAFAILGVLGPLTAPFCTGPFRISEISLFGEDEDGKFHLITRYPLTG